MGKGKGKEELEVVLQHQEQKGREGLPEGHILDE